ncbi:hypothetical protein PAHAL_9G267200 [Panicum hallii]|uniref:Uncharacterized protein n=1 Tax=Panicum hallii TaxID=206008 RepID=A0A2S3IMB1_9POAL|nr:hypothetical protein PAHAL_9G267200 [Panicum hallii]
MGPAPAGFRASAHTRAVAGRAAARSSARAPRRAARRRAPNFPAPPSRPPLVRCRRPFLGHGKLGGGGGAPNWAARRAPTFLGRGRLRGCAPARLCAHRSPLVCPRRARRSRGGSKWVGMVFLISEEHLDPHRSSMDPIYLQLQSNVDRICTDLFLSTIQTHAKFKLDVI